MRRLWTHSTQIAIALVIAIGCAPRAPMAAATGGHPAPEPLPSVVDPHPLGVTQSPAPNQPEQRAGVETQDQLPCTQQAIEASGVRQQLSELDGQFEAMGETADADTVAGLAAKLRDLGRSRCFKLLPHAQIPQSSTTAEGLRWFWSHGGKEWAMQVLTDDPSHRVTPPPVPESLRLETVSAAKRIFLCRDAVCAPETAAWKIRAERTINAIGLAPEYTARRPCRRGLQVPGWSEFDLELECASAEAGLTWVLPLGSFVAPSDGVLMTDASVPGCSEWRALDAATGRALWVTRCGKHAPRIGLGRVDANLLREAIFGLFVAPHVKSGPTAATIDIPPAIRPLSSLGEFPDGVDGRAAASSRQVKHSLGYWHKGTRVLSETLKWPEDLAYPQYVYLVWLLDAVDASWRGNCSARREYRSLANALISQFPALTDALTPLREAKDFACETNPLARLGARSS
jgi:hypothetical protein